MYTYKYLLKTLIKIMSGVAFNPMRKSPLPPPYIDTVGINPEEYISVEPNDGTLFLVSRECLRVSPFIRRAFEKRVDIFLDDIEILFYNADDDSEEEEEEGENEEQEYGNGGELDSASSPELLAGNSHPNAKMRQRGRSFNDESSKNNGSSRLSRRQSKFTGDDSFGSSPEGRHHSTAENDGLKAGEQAGSGRKKQQTIFPEDPLYAIPKIPKPVEVLTETLQNNKMIVVRFPTLQSATLEVVIAYLYFKFRFDGRQRGQQDQFSVPLPLALDIMKLASLLEC